MLNQAEQLVESGKPDKEYLPITGMADFAKLAAKLAYGGESVPFTENRVCTIST